MTYNDAYAGKQIGNYRIVKEIAHGAFGSVYLAQHLYLTGRTVVIKLLHQIHLGSQQERESFIGEAQILEQLKHPYILSILDVGIDNGQPYLIAEYASHGSLRERLQRHSTSPLPIDEALTILSQVGQALQHAHQQSIIHRDIKPENILFNAKDEALLADFGISTILSTTSVKYTQITGTPAYMAPEQFRGIVSRESDQYALGCVAYELFTGRKPFAAPDFIAMGFKHATEPLINPKRFNPYVSLHIDQAICKAMAKDRAGRFSNVNEFVVALSVAPQKPPDSKSSKQESQHTAKSDANKTNGDGYIRHKSTDTRKQKEAQSTTNSDKDKNDDYIYTGRINTNTRRQEIHNTYQQKDDVATDPFHSISLSTKIISGMFYLISIFAWPLFFLVKDKRFARFHFIQSILVLILLFCLALICVLCGSFLEKFYFLINAIDEVVMLLSYGCIMLYGVGYMFAAFATFRGSYFKLPLIGTLAEKFANKRPI